LPQISEQHSNESCHCLGKIPLVVVELYRMLGYFFIGALGALLTTEMAKYKIGRLRPFFLTVCNLELVPIL
jgi:phosphatidate phosphatase